MNMTFPPVRTHAPQHRSAASSPSQRLFFWSVITLCLQLWLSSGMMAQPLLYLGETPAAADDCICLNNASTATDGQFATTVTIQAPTGQTWHITSASGLYSTTSAAPPAAPLPVTEGTLVPEVPSAGGRYQLAARLIDSQPLSLTVENDLGQTLSLSHLCSYPNPQILDLPPVLCMTSVAIPLQGQAPGTAGSGSFTINGSPATVFNPYLLGAGAHTVTYTFTASGQAGCSQSVSQSVFVHPLPTIAVNAQVNVTMNPSCEVLILPDMVLEGTYPCLESDFYVVVYAPNGTPLGNSIGPAQIGQLLAVRVFTTNSGLFGDGSILVSEGLLPQLACPPDTDQLMVARHTQLLGGQLQASHPAFSPSGFACFQGLLTSASGQHRYRLDTIQVTESGYYTLELSAAYGRGMGALYRGYFDAFEGPCVNQAATSRLLEAGEGFFTAQDSVVRITVYIEAGEPYTLFTSSAAAGATGQFTWAIYQSNGTEGEVLGLPSFSAELNLPLCFENLSQFLATGTDYTGTPSVSNDCGAGTLSYTDQVVNNGRCFPVHISRTFRVANLSGAASQCTQQITMPKVKLSEVVLPPKTVVLDCSSSFELTPAGRPAPEVTGYPAIQTAFGVYDLRPSFCNVQSAFTDMPIVATCGGSYQFIRRWTILDNCDVGQFFFYHQTIRIADRTPPVVACTPIPDSLLVYSSDTLTYNMVGANCSSTFRVPMPVVTDHCSDWTVVTQIVTETRTPIYSLLGLIIGYHTETTILATIPANAVSRTVSNIPAGCHLIRYTVTDACGNVTVTECPVCVKDAVIPTAICDDQLNVSLGGNGIGRLFAADVDEGSNDNCGTITHLEVRRLVEMSPASCASTSPFFTTWAPHVDMLCCESGTLVTVQLRVTDSNGNINTCETEVMVSDPTKPTCVPPANVGITCGDVPAGFAPNDPAALQAVFGTASFTDNCANNTSIEELAPTVNLSACGTGSITRRFRAVDAFGNTSVNPCQQVVTITGQRDYRLRFPKDAQVACSPAQADSLLHISAGCEHLDFSVSDELLSTSGSACARIRRTYHVKDLCQYDGFSAPMAIGRDEACTGTQGGEAVWLIATSAGFYLDRNSNHGDLVPAAGSKGTSCDGSTNPSGYWRQVANANGYWTYVQIIEVFDDMPPLISTTNPPAFCTAGAACEAAVNIGFSVTEGCSPENISIQVFLDLNADGILDGSQLSGLSGTYPFYTVSGTYPMGNHAFRVSATDACGNTTLRTILFSVVDCVAATPTCINGLAAELVPNGPGGPARTILATQMLTGASTADCSGTLRYSIHRTNDLLNGFDLPNADQDRLMFDCSDLGMVLVRIYSWDEAYNPYSIQPDGTVGGRNFSFCETFIVVQDNNSHCAGPTPTTGAIAGLIYTEAMQPVEGVALNTNVPVSGPMMTDTNGEYMISGLAMGGDYTVVPVLNGGLLNGLSTMDLILITRHILGMQALDSPYKIIAADVNRSATVTTLDVIVLRRAILGLADEFPNNTSWRFVRANFVFPNPADPWLTAFPELVSINNLGTMSSAQDFIAIKVGDVNLSASPANLSGTEERSTPRSGLLRLQTPELLLQPGHTYRIPIHAPDLAAVQGYQFTIEIDRAALQYLDVEGGTSPIEHFGLRFLADGLITTSWQWPQAAPGEPSSGPLFTLVLRAQRTGLLSEALAVNSRHTAAEAYGSAGDILDIALDFTVQSQVYQGYELAQNKPNPFRQHTVVGFTLPERAGATLTVFDAAGRVLKRIENTFEAGQNEVLLHTADFSVRGVLYYRLDTGTFTATRKMILID